MLTTIDIMRGLPGRVFYAVPGMNVIALWLFSSVMFWGGIPVDTLLPVLGIAACLGVWIAFFITYRCRFGASYSLSIQAYWYLFVELMSVGSIAPFMLLLVGRQDLVWWAFFAYAFCVLLSVSVGVHTEALRIGWKGRQLCATGWWREELDRHIDYTARRVRPSLTAQKPPRFPIKHPALILGAGVNIPLIFELYGGARNNALFFAALLATPAVMYLNTKTFGPVLLRLFLLRRLENEVGYCFQNADYEQIQELRRGFFLARWLMKDYRPPKPPGDTETSLAPSSKDLRKRKRRR